MNINNILWKPTYTEAKLSEGRLLRIVGTQAVSKSPDGTERSKEFYIYAQGITKVGNYDLLHKFNVENDGEVVAKYQDITRSLTAVSSTTFIGESGKLSITRFDKSVIEGTFSFMAATQYPRFPKETVTVENGKFFLQIAK